MGALFTLENCGLNIREDKVKIQIVLRAGTETRILTDYFEAQFPSIYGWSL